MNTIHGITAVTNRTFYIMKPLLPRRVQLGLRRVVAHRKLKRHADVWPIDPSSSRKPREWPGWPEEKQFALVLTHDVESLRGLNRCIRLMRREQSFQLRSAFNFVPERYETPSRIRNCLTDHGFEVGVHGLKHDGRLYHSRRIFSQRAERINHYLKEWNAVGFRSPAMHHNLEWLLDLNIAYDSSTFDTDPFEPQSDGVGTIFPFVVEGGGGGHGYIELPYTLPQDFSVFVLFQERNIEIWKRKLEWIANNGGMALLNTHPDYMADQRTSAGVDEYCFELYEQFLEHVTSAYKGLYWNALPKEVAVFMRRSFPSGNRPPRQVPIPKRQG